MNADGSRSRRAAEDEEPVLGVWGGEGGVGGAVARVVPGGAEVGGEVGGIESDGAAGGEVEDGEAGVGATGGGHVAEDVLVAGLLTEEGLVGTEAVPGDGFEKVAEMAHLMSGGHLQRLAPGERCTGVGVGDGRAGAVVPAPDA